MTMHANIHAHDQLLWFGNTLIAIKIASSAGIDGISVVEHWMPHGEAPPLHVHHREDEIFHVMEGEMRFRVGSSEQLVCAGETVIAPKGVPHQFRVESASGAHCITITHGADFESMLRQCGRPAAHPGLPQAVAPTPEMIDALIAACAANKIDILGPPLG